MGQIGYANYQDPRLIPPEEPEGPFCRDCTYYREVTQVQGANGLTHIHCACVFEVFQADTFEELDKADIVTVDPWEEACDDFNDRRRSR